jgi:predicted transcriptional regulator
MTTTTIVIVVEGMAVSFDNRESHVAPRFTERELDVMAVLWEHGPSTVAEVQERIEDELAYNTILTVLRTLEGKGRVGHREEGRAHRYHPLVSRRDAAQSAVGRLVERLFGGSHELLLSQLVNDERLTEADLRRIRELLNRELEERS